MTPATTKATANTVAVGGDSKLQIAANKIANIYLSDISNLNAAVGMPMTEESKRCGVNALLYLCGEMGADAVQSLPKAQLVQVLQFVTINGLDVFSGQVFMDKRRGKDGSWSIKATPMGSAYEIMTKRFGVDVKTVHPARIVHEGDDFTLPQFDGLKMTNAVLKPTLKGLDGKAIAVYYIIEKTDGTLDFAIATRDGVAKNLMAQILNATLRDANVNRNELMAKMEGKSLDDLLSDPYLARFISPAYRSPASRESMIVTKMKKNALLHYTRDLGSAAYTKVNASVVADDEASDLLTQEAKDGTVSETEAKPNKIADFSVDDEGVVEAPENPAKPEPKVEVAEKAVEVENSAKPQPKAETPKVEEAPKEAVEPEQMSVFGFDDL